MLGLALYWFAPPCGEMGEGAESLGKITIFSYISYLFVYFIFSGCLLDFFPGDQVHHPAHYTTRTILQEGHGRHKLLARARNCTGQLKHPLAHRVPDHSFNPFGDLLPAMVIFISMSATTDSLLNCP